MMPTTIRRLAAALLMMTGTALAWTGNEIDFPNTANGFPDPATSGGSVKYTGPDGSPEWFRYTQTATNIYSPFAFKMTTGNTWDNDYGGNAVFPKNEVDIMYYQPLGDANSELAGGASNGFRYVFTAKDPPLSDAYISVMEVSDDPVFIEQAGGTVGTIASNGVIEMNILFFTNPPPEQKAYFRVSTDDFATWTLIEAPITADTASAVYTSTVSSTVTTKWYAFTSTASSNYLANTNSFTIDALTLSWDNRQGTNFLVKVNPRDVAFVYHDGNRVVFGSNVQFYAKAGYANGDGSGRWANFGAVYYTTDGSEPSGSKGVPSGSSMARPLSFSFMEEDESPIGDAMWFVGTVTNLPAFTTIKYKIGLWYDAGSPERFADYQSVTNDTTYSFQLGVSGAPSLTVNGLEADYTTSKFWIDEIAGDTEEVVVYYRPGIAAVPDNVEIFSNLNRRDYTEADSDTNGIPDAIRPPDGNTITTNTTDGYFMAWPMTAAEPGVYVWTGVVSKCGAYRLTARYQTNGTWRYYTENGRRDHAVVASPKKILDQTMYELNTLTIEAQSPDEGGRSTFVDLLSADEGDDDGYDPFNLSYLDSLAANCLWFQPIHPNGEERVENDSATQSPYTPGSPYATKDYFAIGRFYGSDATEADALSEFTNFVAKCDIWTGEVGTINVMLDGVFNHTAWDAEFGQGVVDLGLKQNPGDSGSPLLEANEFIGEHRAYWYSDGGNGNPDYCDEADFWNSAYDNDFAVAPDRGDFGKWNDVAELYFGRYAALVCLNPQDNGSYLNEGDWYDYGSQMPGVIELWKLFAYYPEYWIKKTGHSGTNSFVLAEDDKGIDGLRCDFGQGLPPQLWEYIINRTRSIKWNFMFMAETLDGGKPGYRSNRHFDILNENLVFQFTQAKVNNSFDLYNALEQRENAYNGGTILLNLTSHDEILPDDDPWVTASRYGVVGSVDGIPMIMYGQEHGIKNYQSDQSVGWDDGFIYHELNFGKYIPHFKKWNQLTVWFNDPPNSTGILEFYSRINRARLASPALRSQNRYFLRRTAMGDNEDIFAVAKAEIPGAGPAAGDVVLAFANMLEHGGAHAAEQDTYDLKAPWAFLGLDTNKTYTVRNLASSDPDAVLPGWPRTGQDLWDSGIFVQLQADIGQAITNDGALVQYLKLEEIDVNDAPVITLPGPHTLAVGATTNIPVSVTDADLDPVTTNVTVSPAGSIFTNGVLTWMAGAADENTTNEIRVVADDQQGQPNSIVTNSTFIIVPFDIDGDLLGDGWEFSNFGTLTNGAAGDNDGDNSPNIDEYNAGTAPTNAQSVFKVTEVENAAGQTVRNVSIATQPGKVYTIYFADGNPEDDATWQPFADGSDGVGTYTETNTVPATFVFTDDESASTTGGAPAEGQRNYRIIVNGP